MVAAMPEPPPRLTALEALRRAQSVALGAPDALLCSQGPFERLEVVAQLLALAKDAAPASSPSRHEVAYGRINTLALDARDDACASAEAHAHRLEVELRDARASLAALEPEVKALRAGRAELGEVQRRLHAAEAGARHSAGAVQLAEERACNAEASARARVESTQATLQHALAVAEGQGQRAVANFFSLRHDYDRLAGIAAALEARERDLAATVAGWEAAGRDARRERDVAVQKLEAETLRVSGIEARAEQAVVVAQASMHAGVYTAGLEAARLSAEAAALQVQVRQGQGVLERQAADLAGYAVELEQRVQQLAAAHGKVDGLQRKLAAADAHAAALQHELAASNAKVQALERELGAADVVQTDAVTPFVPLPGHVTAADEDDSLAYPDVPSFLLHLRKLGMTRAQLVLGVDCTKSNLWSGKVSFGARSLHDVSDPSKPTPYQRIIRILGQALKDFDDDGLIPLYGFGCSRTQDTGVFSFKADGQPCAGIQDALEAYAAVMPGVTLSGPTSFAPLIRKTIEIVRKDRDFTVLVIIADGQVTAVRQTQAAIVEASKLPIAIVCVGVGDGPWEEMKGFDDGIPARKVDNFQSVEFAAVVNAAREAGRALEDYFTLAALAELPQLIPALKRLRLM